MLYLLGPSLTAIGEIVVAYTVIKVHDRIMKEHKIDAKVLKTMRKEQSLAITGVIMIATGWIIHILDNVI